MGSMLKCVLGHKTILYNGNKNDVIEYKIDGTLLRDCTYSEKYKDRILEIIMPLLSEETKFVNIYSGIKPNKKSVVYYQNRAKYFVIPFINNDKIKHEILEDLENIFQSLCCIQYIKT